MATLMLEGGADIRFIQETLGHADPRTTQVYTLVSIKKLQHVHAARHPAARLQHVARAEDGGEEEAPSLAADLRAELLEELEAEVQEEEQPDSAGSG